MEGVYWKGDFYVKGDRKKVKSNNCYILFLNYIELKGVNVFYL